MSQDSEHISKKTVVYRIEGMDDVRVRRDVAYETSGAETLTLDVYYPPGAFEGARVPAVVFVAGFPDAGYEVKLGCKFKEMAATVSWARLTAATGLAAITYTNREPANGLDALLRYVREHAAQLGIDERRIGLWAGSGNVPLALSALMREGSGRVKCAVLCYGFMLDLDGAMQVAEASKMWGFVNPCAEKSIADLPPDVPLFIARAGRDQIPHLNETLDRFVTQALKRNLPLTFVNHAAAPHAFDLSEDSETSREMIRQILAFMRFHLAAG
ncbi:MAG TPA: alpha/beta hydrolase [Pyrinomonadaceae bacterium]|nr:alpha/beta hydrolase [Pyrinomonadaceae bacterium]